ncbi:hypothetical protein HYH02_014339 [Chlamydomonas schloesseri]|uniref:Uncharacterized protein n=1 Tax=Chlamydomonas schloesseri TaxID=2026947 RepID=A0A835SXC2_9CHLO|nr:hypothetical protein HYH02_014339 [Chlamydomonas schloesseri]|eukprot:KAG2428535.1 hypothetical protein HYH02_014339 [Chlamydomonas schloesseri]
MTANLYTGADQPYARTLAHATDHDTAPTAETAQGLAEAMSHELSQVVKCAVAKSSGGGGSWSSWLLGSALPRLRGEQQQQLQQQQQQQQDKAAREQLRGVSDLSRSMAVEPLLLLGLPGLCGRPQSAGVLGLAAVRRLLAALLAARVNSGALIQQVPGVGPEVARAALQSAELLVEAAHPHLVLLALLDLLHPHLPPLLWDLGLGLAPAGAAVAGGETAAAERQAQKDKQRGEEARAPAGGKHVCLYSGSPERSQSWEQGVLAHLSRAVQRLRAQAPQQPWEQRPALATPPEQQQQQQQQQQAPQARGRYRPAGPAGTEWYNAEDAAEVEEEEEEEEGDAWSGPPAALERVCLHGDGGLAELFSAHPRFGQALYGALLGHLPRLFAPAVPDWLVPAEEQDAPPPPDFYPERRGTTTPLAVGRQLVRWLVAARGGGQVAADVQQHLRMMAGVSPAAVLGPNGTWKAAEPLREHGRILRYLRSAAFAAGDSAGAALRCCGCLLPPPAAALVAVAQQQQQQQQQQQAAAAHLERMEREAEAALGATLAATPLTASTPISVRMAVLRLRAYGSLWLPDQRLQPPPASQQQQQQQQSSHDAHPAPQQQPTKAKLQQGPLLSSEALLALAQALMRMPPTRRLQPPPHYGSTGSKNFSSCSSPRLSHLAGLLPPSGPMARALAAMAAGDGGGGSGYAGGDGGGPYTEAELREALSRVLSRMVGPTEFPQALADLHHLTASHPDCELLLADLADLAAVGPVFVEFVRLALGNARRAAAAGAAAAAAPRPTPAPRPFDPLGGDETLPFGVAAAHDAVLAVRPVDDRQALLAAAPPLQQGPAQQQQQQQQQPHPRQGSNLDLEQEQGSSDSEYGDEEEPAAASEDDSSSAGDQQRPRQRPCRWRGARGECSGDGLESGVEEYAAGGAERYGRRYSWTPKPSYLEQLWRPLQQQRERERERERERQLRMQATAAAFANSGAARCEGAAAAGVASSGGSKVAFEPDVAAAAACGRQQQAHPAAPPHQPLLSQPQPPQPAATLWQHPFVVPPPNMRTAAAAAVAAAIAKPSARLRVQVELKLKLAAGVAAVAEPHLSAFRRHAQPSQKLPLRQPPPPEHHDRRQQQQQAAYSAMLQEQQQLARLQVVIDGGGRAGIGGGGLPLGGLMGGLLMDATQRPHQGGRPPALVGEPYPYPAGAHPSVCYLEPLWGPVVQRREQERQQRTAAPAAAPAAATAAAAAAAGGADDHQPPTDVVRQCSTATTATATAASVAAGKGRGGDAAPAYGTGARAPPHAAAAAGPRHHRPNQQEAPVAVAVAVAPPPQLQLGARRSRVARALALLPPAVAALPPSKPEYARSVFNTAAAAALAAAGGALPEGSLAAARKQLRAQVGELVRALTVDPAVGVRRQLTSPHLIGALQALADLHALAAAHPPCHDDMLDRVFGQVVDSPAMFVAQAVDGAWRQQARDVVAGGGGGAWS